MFFCAPNAFCLKSKAPSVVAFSPCHEVHFPSFTLLPRFGPPPSPCPLPSPPFVFLLLNPPTYLLFALAHTQLLCFSPFFLYYPFFFFAVLDVSKSLVKFHSYPTPHLIVLPLQGHIYLLLFGLNFFFLDWAFIAFTAPLSRLVASNRPESYSILPSHTSFRNFSTATLRYLLDRTFLGFGIQVAFTS